MLRGTYPSAQRLAVLLYVVLWSSGFIPSRVLVHDVTPLWGAVIRLLLAGGILVAWRLLCRDRWPERREWNAIVGIAVATNVVYLGLLYVALRHLTSGMAAIIASTNPLMLALVAPRLLRERLSLMQVCGLVLGFVGVVAIMASRAGASVDRVTDEAIALVSVSGLVASTVLFKRTTFVTSLPLITGLQLCIGAIAVLPIAFALEGAPRPELHAGSWLALAYLVVVMSIGASLLWFWLLERGEASRLSAYYYITPVLGLVLSRLLLKEPLRLWDIAGAAVVALGIALVQRAPVARRGSDTG